MRPFGAAGLPLSGLAVEQPIELEALDGQEQVREGGVTEIDVHMDTGQHQHLPVPPQ